MTPKQILSGISKATSGNKQLLLYILGGIVATGVVAGAIMYSSGSSLKGMGQSNPEIEIPDIVVQPMKPVDIPVLLAPAISNLTISPAQFDPKKGEQTTIEFDLNVDVDTLTVYFYSIGSPSYFSSAPMVSKLKGHHTTQWSGYLDMYKSWQLRVTAKNAYGVYDA